MTDHITSLLPIETFPPAVAQGCVCLECRTDDQRTNDLLAPLDDPASRTALTVERMFLRELNGSCRTPIAGYATLEGDAIQFHGLIASFDGQQVFEDRVSGSVSDPEQLGQETGRVLREKAGARFMAEMAAQSAG